MTEWLESRSRLIIALAVIVTLILIPPYLLLRPEVEASQDPGGEVFDLRDDVETRFESEIHGIAVLIESRTGDILTRDGLLSLYENSQKLRNADEAGELTPDGLPVRPYLLRRFDPDTNTVIHGTTSIADHVAQILALDPRFDTTLAEATDDQVKLAVYRIFENPDSAGLRESLSVLESSETRVLDGEEFTAWSAPALMTFVLADNEKLGEAPSR